MLLVATQAHADDIVVRGQKREAGGTTMTRDELREMPGAFGDPARMIEAMPSVIPVATALPFYFVRGATPANTGYFLDGMRVPLFSHTPPGGGIVAGSAIDRVDFFPGAAPVRFGGVTGGVLSVSTLQPAEHARAEVGVRLYDSSALVESPLDDGRASILASARYGYTQWLLDVFSPTERQQYWDYYARATWNPSRQSRDHRLSVVGVGAHDFVGRPNETIVEATFHRAELRYDVATRGGGVRVAATTGINTQGNNVGSVDDTILGVRAEATQPIARDLRIGLGASATHDRYGVTVNPGVVQPTNPEILFAPRSDLANAAFGELSWRVSDAVQIDGGVRVGMFATKRDAYPARYGFFGRENLLPPSGAASKPAVDPRLSARVRVHRRATFIAAFGIAHGPPSFFLPGLTMSRLEDGLQTAVQASSGFELALPADLTAKVTGFAHNYLDLTDPSATCADQTALVFNPIDSCFARRVRGRTFGGELLVRRPLTKRLSGWLSYTLSRSTREAHAPGWTIIGKNEEALVDGLSEWDRTHVLSAVGGYDLGRGWRAAVRFSYLTGRPYSRTVRGVQVAPFNAERLPDVHRIDLRLEKKWMLDADRSVSVVLEAFNVTGMREVSECRPGVPIQTAPVPEALVRGQPVDACTFQRYPAFLIPSIGVEAKF